ncbi:hypothetical protein [Acidipropionibacterium timonense]|uniref:hypothetical protein n=1 Tax=Acidipropionibacterium timonense TaxID=2161818 RepID=UPI0014367FE4|nr:hypothetical protein [Acidipropionibacterium timonense]
MSGALHETTYDYGGPIFRPQRRVARIQMPSETQVQTAVRPTGLDDVREAEPWRSAAVAMAPERGVDMASRQADAAPEKVQRHGLNLHGHEILGGACASALATGVVGSLGISGSMIGSAVTSLVIAVSGALFTRWFAHTRRRVGAGRERGIWARTVAVAAALTVVTGVIGALVLGQEVGSDVNRSLSQAMVDVTSSGYRWQQMFERAWPYLKEAWRAAHR